MRPKKPVHHTMTILTGRTITQFSCICNFMLLVWNQTIFAVEVPSTISTPYFKFLTKSCQAFLRYKLPKLLPSGTKYHLHGYMTYFQIVRFSPWILLHTFLFHSMPIWQQILLVIFEQCEQNPVHVTVYLSHIQLAIYYV